MKFYDRFLAEGRPLSLLQGAHSKNGRKELQAPQSHTLMHQKGKEAREALCDWLSLKVQFSLGSG